MGFVSSLVGSLFGGGFSGDGGAQNDPLPPPRATLRIDPEIEASRKRQLLAEKRRKGRQSTILTGARGLEDDDAGAALLKQTAAQAAEGGQADKLG